VVRTEYSTRRPAHPRRTSLYKIVHTCLITYGHIETVGRSPADVARQRHGGGEVGVIQGYLAGVRECTGRLAENVANVRTDHGREPELGPGPQAARALIKAPQRRALPEDISRGRSPSLMCDCIPCGFRGGQRGDFLARSCRCLDLAVPEGQP